MSVKVVQSCPTLCNPMHYIVHVILQARILEWVAFHFSADLLNTGIKPRSAALQADSLPAKPPGKPKNTGMGRLSLLYRLFPTQELNQGLLYCRWILYQLSNQGSLNRDYSTSITCYLILLFQLVKCWCVCVETEEAEWKYVKLY